MRGRPTALAHNLQAGHNCGAAAAYMPFCSGHNIAAAAQKYKPARGTTLEFKNLELRGNDGVWAAGTYSVTVKDKTIQGNWVRILKRENGNWKMAMEAFARAGVIDAPPAAAIPSQTPDNSK
jgi:hypothetical protein